MPIMLARLGGAAALTTILLGAPAVAQTSAPAADAVAAIVNGDEVQVGEVQATMRGLPDQYRQMPFEMMYPSILDRVIDFRLLAAEAERLDMAARPEVQEQLAQARANVMRDAVIQEKIAEGSTEEALRERFAELEGSEEFAQEEVHARHILLESEDDAKEAIEAIAAGADFAEVAKERSTGPSASSGGDLGYFRREQMVPEFAEAAFAMADGETSTAPVQTQFGYHVIMVVDRRTATPTFEESEPQLRQDLAREIINGLVAGLREGAEMERFGLDGEPLPDQPPAAQ
jgi:peptidyl-prolyl cis-trans isomerase C